LREFVSSIHRAINEKVINRETFGCQQFYQQSQLNWPLRSRDLQQIPTFPRSEEWPNKSKEQRFSINQKELFTEDDEAFNGLKIKDSGGPNLAHTLSTTESGSDDPWIIQHDSAVRKVKMIEVGETPCLCGTFFLPCSRNGFRRGTRGNFCRYAEAHLSSEPKVKQELVS